MLKGEPAREQCVVIDGVNFLNTRTSTARRRRLRGAEHHDGRAARS